MKIVIKSGCEDNFEKQSSLIQRWISAEEGKIDDTIITDTKITYKTLFDQFLGGVNVAGVGQGRFSNKTKEKLKKNENWKEIVKRLIDVSSVNADLFPEDTKKEGNSNQGEYKVVENSGLKKACNELQDKLVSFCKTTTKKDGNEVEVDEHKPWAAIHAMIVALKPDAFCTIVSENNLNELYKKLDKAHKSINAGQQQEQADNQEQNDSIKDNDFVFKGGKAWDTLQKQWKLACGKKIVDERMSWYYKSAAVQNYFGELLASTDDKWMYKNYPWETLMALRGEENIKNLSERLIKQRNIILTGAPGTGKTYLARKVAAATIGCDVAELMDTNKDQYKFVQFHPSYDYTDFVEGLRPDESDKKSNEENEENEAVDKTVVFKRQDGVFKDFCKKAAPNQGKKYVFVIDEINRGEISKVFGELFFSIDPGYRGEKDKDGFINRVDTQYQNLVPDNDEFKAGFYVPNNVYVIGTMNDIDRSVESMDFAFRRRFAFHEVSAVDSEAMIYAAKDEEGWTPNIRQGAVDMMESLNKAIISKCGLSEQYQIGGAYFLKLKDVNFGFDDLWEYYLKGTLYEYFRGLPSKDIEDKMKILEDAYNNGSDD